MNEAKDNRFFECNGMASHPDQNKFYVASESGLYEFDMTGATAKITRLTAGSVKEVKLDKKGVIWATTSNGSVYKKEDGQAIKIVNQGYSSGGRTAIAISPDDDNYVYTMGAGGAGANYGRLVGVYRTTNGGATWEQIIVGNSNNNIFVQRSMPTRCGVSCSQNQALVLTLQVCLQRAKKMVMSGFVMDKRCGPHWLIFHVLVCW
jgi:sugar lactone lactonase YvrE